MSHRHLLAVAAAVLPVAAACAESDDTPPVLRVDTPERGTLAEATTVTVTGQVTDDAPGRLRVEVNGVEATLALDGTFSATVEVAPGITIVETVAVDGGGNRVEDVRAVLAGTLAPVDGAVRDALALQLGPAGLAAIGDGVGNVVAAMDLTAAVQPMNPVFQDPGCLGAEVDVTGVAIQGVEVGLVPGVGQLDTAVVLTGVRVDLHADYEVACIGGSANLAVLADRVVVTGGVGIDVADGDLRSAARDVAVSLEGFDLEAGGLPGAVLDLIEGIIDDRVAAALRDVIAEQVPAQVDAALADLAGATFAVPALGREIAVTVTPTDVDVEASGVFVTVDAALRVSGGEGAAYLTTPGGAADTSMRDTTGAAVGIADDALNQLFAGLWASGALDLGLDLEPGNPLQLLLGADAARVDVAMSLPPTVSAAGGGDLRIAVGDALLVVRDAAGEELSRTAMSLATTIGAAAEAGGIELRLGEPEVHAQVLWQSDRNDRPMEGEDLEELVTTVWDIIGTQAEDALGALPLPSIANVSMSSPSLEAISGFAVVRADLTAAP